MNIPKWIKKQLKYFKCINCQENTRLKGICGIGVHLSAKDSKQVFFIQYKCIKCEQRMNIQINQMTTQQLAIQLNGELMSTSDDSEIKSQKNKKISKSLISQKQVTSVKKFLNSQDDFQIFLNYFGAQNIKQEKQNEKNI